jgi:hypothetical protein
VVLESLAVTVKSWVCFPTGTDGRTDIKCVSNGRKNLITLTDQTNKMYQSRIGILYIKIQK